MNSFLQGKKALSIPQLRPMHVAPPPAIPSTATLTATATPTAPGHTHAAGGDPTVEVVKEGDKIVRLVVLCTCGQRVEIECLYPVGSR